MKTIPSLIIAAACCATMPANAQTVIITATDAEATRGPSPDNGAFTIVRLDGDWSQPLTVQFSIGGTAVSGADYQVLDASATIPADAGSVVVTVIPSAQSGSAHESSVVLTLVPDGQGTYNVGLPETAAVSIYDPSVPSPSPAPTPSGLVAWWAGEGNAWDAAGGGRGAVVGAVNYSRAEVAQGFSIEGSASGVAITPSSSFDLQDFTIEAWIRRGDPYLVSWDTYADGLIFSGPWASYGFGLTGDGRLFLSLIGYSAVYPSLAVTDTDTFHHVAVTKSGSTVVFYLDGVAETTEAYDPGFQSGGPFAVGARGGDFFNSFFGKIDEVSLYNRPLSQSEIQSIYSAAWSGKRLSPIIFEQPQARSLAIGDPATFKVVAGGTPQLSYQWRLNGNNLAGKTSPTLSFSAIQPSDAGAYSVTIINSLGIATSSDAVLTVAPPPSCASVTSGLVAWWAGENNALDWAGANNGTLGAGVDFSPGRVGTAFNFTADYSAISIGAPNALQVQDFTIEAWIQRANADLVSYAPNVDALFLSGGWFGYGFGLAADGHPLLSKIGVDGLVPNVTVSDTDWHHLALTKSGDTVVFYVDGVAYPTDPYSTVFDLGSDMAIGGRGGDFFNSFHGKIDELAFYDRPLASSEIQSIYNAGWAGKCHDADSNGLNDAWEVHYFGHTGVDPNADPDGDGLSNLQEYGLGTNPNDPDTDHDGLTDLEELNIPIDVSNPSLGHLDPLKADTGNTGRPDGDKDADHDGLSNISELRTFHTDPARAISFTNTTKNDAQYLFTADGGSKSLVTFNGPTFPGGGRIGFSISGASPTDAYDIYFVPNLYQGWRWRRIYIGAPGQTQFVFPDPNPGSGYYQIGIASSDYDGDGLSDGYETVMRYGNPNSGPKTSPTLPDSEQPTGDKLHDGWEVQYGLDPTSAAPPNGGNDDPDGDSLSNKTEHDLYVFPNPAYDPLKPFSGPPRPIVTITATDPAADELGDTATFTIRRYVGNGNLNSDLTVYYCIGGSATYATDYTLSPIGAQAPRIFSATIPASHDSVDVVVSPLADNIIEGTETVTLALIAYDLSASSPTYAQPVNWPYVVDPAHDRATINIFDAKPLGLAGFMVNLQLTTNNYLQIKPTSDTSPSPFVNIASSGRGTVARIKAVLSSNPTDPTTWSRIAGEYFTSPGGTPWGAGNPSRTTVDRYGNAWVANRNIADANGGSVTYIGVVIGGTRGTRTPETGTPFTFTPDQPNATTPGEWLQPPFIYNTCIDRNGDGLIRTSYGRTAAGVPSILTWPSGDASNAKDEAILRYVRVTPTAVRSIAVDRDNNLWTGSRIFGDNPAGNGWQEYIDGSTGVPVTGRKFSFGSGGYGGIVDGFGVLWSAGYANDGMLRLVLSGSTPPVVQGGVMAGTSSGYGLGIDPKTGNVWLGNYDNGTVWRFTSQGCNELLNGAVPEIKGIVVDGKDNVWIAASSPLSTEVYHLRTSGEVVGAVTLSHPTLSGVAGRGPSGVCVDAQGMVWAACYVAASNGKFYAMRIDPTKGPLVNNIHLGQVVEAVDLGDSVNPDNATPYNYSDMSGFVTIGTTQPAGFWDFVEDSSADDSTWLRVGTDADVPANSSLLVEVRAANRITELPSWPFRAVQSGGVVPAGIKGHYLEVRTTLLRNFCPGATCVGPLLRRLTVQKGAPACSALQINTHPANQIVTPGQNATFTVAASGATSYQWLKNGGTVSGATSSTLSLNNAQYSDAASYAVRVSGSGGCTLQSGEARLHIKGNAPQVTISPVTQTVNPGDSVTFTARATATAAGANDSGYLPIYYQWRLNGTPIAGASGQCGSGTCDATFTLAHAQCQDGGAYSVAFHNQYGQVLSASAQLTVSGTNPLTVTPDNVTVSDPSVPVTLTASACFVPACIQWYLNNLPIPGANQLTYTIGGPSTPITCDQMGTYTCVVFDTIGASYQASANVGAASPVAAVAQIKLIANAGTGWAYTWYFSTSATGPWGNSIGSGPNFIASYSTAPPGPDAYYRVVATHSGQPDRSAVVQLYWWSGDNADVVVMMTENMSIDAVFTASAVGVGPLSYQWWAPGSSTASDGPDYDVGGINCNSGGQYYVVVGGCGPSTLAYVNLSLHLQTTAAIDQVKLTGNAGAGRTYLWYFSTSSTGPWGISIGSGPDFIAAYSTAPGGPDAYYRVVASQSGQPNRTAIMQLYWSSSDFAYVTVVQTDNMSVDTTYTVKGSGVEPLDYQWWDPSGNAVSTQPQYTIQNVTCAAAGSYTVWVGSCGRSATPAYVQVDANRPGDLAVQTVALSANAGSGWTYHWYFNDTSGSPPDWGNAIGSSATYTVAYSTPPATRDGWYRVLAQKSGQTDRESVVNLYWNSPSDSVLMLESPRAVSIAATLTANATGVGTLSYQWDNPNGNTVSTTSTYVIPDLSTATIGWYWLTARDACGSAVGGNPYIGH